MLAKRKIEKILLIFPPSTEVSGGLRMCIPPLGIAYLGAVLRKDYQVRLLDTTAEGYDNVEELGTGLVKYGLSYQKIKEKISDYSPDLVGITCLYSTQFPFVSKICHLIKEINSDMITAIGGYHPTFLAKECLEKEKSIDFIVLGEGEHTFHDLLKQIEHGTDLTHLEGIAFRREDKLQINPKTNYIENLDELPFPARDLLPMEKYFSINIPMSITSKHKRCTSIATSRGCTARCVFCPSPNFWGHRYRARSADNVLKELELLIKDYQIKEIQFQDDNLILDKKRAVEIFKGIIDRKLKLQWNTPNGIALWKLDEQLLKLMSASGCYELTLAIESGDQEVLSKIIKKPLNLKRVEELTKIIKNLGIETNSFFIVGFPGETKEQIRRTFGFAKKLNLDCSYFFIANPNPGSKLYEICKEKGYLKEDFDFETIDYFKSNYDTPEFTSQDLEKLRNREHVKFNLGLIYRNPIIFLKRHFNIIITNPRGLYRSLIHRWLPFILNQS
ncbi:MAG: cobalamin-dependent protein [Deltaproteobacteria bacterium]|nr:MAG: cobalamin-dependent protein [Deltaproteobacteria bacterium]